MLKLGQYILRAIASVAAHGVGFVKNKAVRQMMLKKLAVGTLEAAAGTALVEGAMYELDKRSGPVKSDAEIAADLREAGIDPEQPLKDGDLPKVLAVMKKHGSSDEAIAKFKAAVEREQALDAANGGRSTTMPSQPTQGYSTMSTTASGDRKEIIRSIKLVSDRLGITPARVPQLAAALLCIAKAPPDLLEEIGDIGRMLVSDVG
jgi:hypothetical protein